ncbi:MULTISPECIES: FTR1 family protein [unclassified Actinomyces]|uniref:FTR1 family iron permease n=1 Tax=unclassified Actinomyces TaxID=2609248 RepID=UPI0013A6B7E4|nr:MULTISPECIES: FTR1 family protein [unclassified Actinomyces]MBW3069319.1 FTR1 family iron permease [Actinomyces sp. 594]NDR52880.1 FTR1 family iron permease [Actinomyces sp. 565]
MPSAPTQERRVSSPARAVIALGVALLLAGVLGGLWSPARAAESDTDYDSWTAVADAISAQLDAAADSYAAGDTSGAAAAFQRAYNSGYVASNMQVVTTDNLGAETASEQRQDFTDLRRAAYAPGNDEAIDSGVTGLSDSLTESAGRLDELADLPDPRTYAADQAAAIATERAELQANKTRVNEGRGERTWADVAAEMNELIDSGVDKAASGDREGGAADVNNAYYGYYEKLGFEKTVMSAISGARVSEVENQFKVVRKAMVGGADITQITAEAETLKNYLTEDGAALDGGAAESISPVRALLTGSFGQAFVILLREGLEAILVVAAVIAYLLKAGMRERVKYIYAGVVLGLAGSGLVALLFAWLYDSASAHQEILEGVVALVAMAMLLFTSNWMLSKSSVASWNRYIKDKAEASISDGGFWALASLSFLAVFREGAETVMFYEALFAMDPSGSASIWQGFAAGAVVLVVVFLLIRFTSVRIPLRPFFAITSFLMAVLVVIFAGGGAHALIEGDIIPATYVEGWPTQDYLGLYPYRETLLFQAFMAAVVVLLSAVSVLRHRRADAAQAAADEDAAAAAE